MKTYRSVQLAEQAGRSFAEIVAEKFDEEEIALATRFFFYDAVEKMMKEASEKARTNLENVGRDIINSSPWMEITVGTDFRYHLKKKIWSSGHRIEEDADKMIEKTEIPGESKKVKLHIVDVRYLGYATSASYDDICQKALSFGYKLCPGELALYLRIRLTKELQPKNQSLYIAMEPIELSSDDPDFDHVSKIYVVDYCRDGVYHPFGPYEFTSLSSTSAPKGKKFPAECLFVFTCD